MRTLATLGIMLAAFIVAGIYVQMHLAQTGRALEESTLTILDAVRRNDWAQAKTQAKELADRWEKTAPRWGLFTEHQEIDDINGAVSRLRAYVEEEDAAGAISEGTAVAQLFRHIPDKESITLTNIL